MECKKITGGIYNHGNRVFNIFNDNTLTETYKYNTRYKQRIPFDSMMCGEIEINENTTCGGMCDLLGINMSKAPDECDVECVKFVQARKHKKKRINKKWLKKYGYKQVITHSKGWKTKTYTDGTFEFVKE